MKQELRIEKNIPVASGYSRSSGKYDVLKKMNIGDSVLFPTPAYNRNNLSNAAKCAFGTGKYSMRATNGGFRVWRTA